MIRKLVRTGNSVAVVLTRDMREHMGVENAVEVQFGPHGQLILRRPQVTGAKRPDAPKPQGR